LEYFSIDLTFGNFLIFALVGVFTGIINTLAGSGSLLTLPVFIFICGLSPSVANGSNRIGVLMQSLVATIKFGQKKPEVFKHSQWLIIPAMVGSIAGSFIAIEINEHQLNMTIGVLMVLMFFLLLLKPERWLKEDKDLANTNYKSSGSILVFFFIGIYGGFIQAGVGFFLLAGLVLVSGFSLSQSNGLKLAIVLAFTLPALIMFIFNGKVHFGYGLFMGLFQSIGAWLSVKYIVSIPNADIWIYRILIIVVAISAIQFLLF
jgi:uncharacterized membrane protein YfcA